MSIRQPPVPEMYSSVRPYLMVIQRAALSPACPAASRSLVRYMPSFLRVVVFRSQVGQLCVEPLVDVVALDLQLGKALDGQSGDAVSVRHAAPPVLSAHCHDHNRGRVPGSSRTEPAAPLRPWNDLVDVKALDLHLGKALDGDLDLLTKRSAHISTASAG